MQHRRLTGADWSAVARDPRFRAFLARRRRFIIPVGIFCFAYYLALPVLVGFAPALMSRPVWGSMTLALAFALSQFVMTFVAMAVFLLHAHALDAVEERIVLAVDKDLT